MINTQVFLENIADSMEDLTWVSPDSAGTTSFVAVYTFPIWANENGFPFLVVLDNPNGSDPESETSEDFGFTSTIDFHICANWPDINGAVNADKRKECMLRVREAYDALREYLASDDNIAAWLSTPNNAIRGSHPSLTWRSGQITSRDENIDEMNLYRRIISLPITDILDNN